MSSRLAHLRLNILDANEAVASVWHDLAGDAFRRRELRPVIEVMDAYLRAESALAHAIEVAEYAMLD